MDHCLFDNAWGDSETISNKSSNNTIRYNVAANCLYSAFTIRSGNDVRFEGNLMANSGGGVRIFGDRHIITNNLFLNLLDAGITLLPGSADSRLRTAATNTLIAHNTFVDCPVTAIGAERESPDSPNSVKGITVRNNLITGARGELVDLRAAAEVDMRRNLVWPVGHARIGQKGDDALVADPLLEASGLALQPAQGSPAVDAAIPLERITLDRWGRNRPVGRAPDIGADEIGSEDRPFDSLPEIPPPPVLIPDLYKGEYAFSVGPDSQFRLADGSLEAASPLPDGFVMEWDYLPEQWTSSASLTFSAGKDDGGYILSWGGATARDGLSV